MVCDELNAAVLCDYDYSNKEKLMERYAKHYQSLSHFDRQRTLKYRVQEGWKPLCEFLEVAAPDQAFPRENDANHLQNLGKLAGRQALRNSTRNLLLGALLIVTISMAFLKLGRHRNLD